MQSFRVFHTSHGKILDFVMGHLSNCNLLRKNCLRSLNLEKMPLTPQTACIMRRPNKDEARLAENRMQIRLNLAVAHGYVLRRRLNDTSSVLNRLSER